MLAEDSDALRLNGLCSDVATGGSWRIAIRKLPGPPTRNRSHAERLPKLTELTRARRARSEMNNPRHRLLDRNSGGGYGFQDVRAWTFPPLRVWMVLKKTLPKQLSKFFFFTPG